MEEEITLSIEAFFKKETAKAEILCGIFRNGQWQAETTLSSGELLNSSRKQNSLKFDSYFDPRRVFGKPSLSNGSSVVYYDKNQKVRYGLIQAAFVARSNQRQLCYVINHEIIPTGKIIG